MYTRGPGHRGVLLRVYAPEKGVGEKRGREGERERERGKEEGETRLKQRIMNTLDVLGVDPAWARRRWSERRKQIKLRNEARDR